MSPASCTRVSAAIKWSTEGARNERALKIQMLKIMAMHFQGWIQPFSQGVRDFHFFFKNARPILVKINAFKTWHRNVQCKSMIKLAA